MTATSPLDVSRRDRVRTVKIVVTGPSPAATSAFVRTIAEVAVLSSEDPGEAATPAAPAVAMDFGRVSLGPDLALYLLGTSGGDHVDVARELVADGMLGAVVVVESAVGETADGPRLDRIVADVVGVPVVVAIDVRGSTTHEDVLIASVREREDLAGDVAMVVADVHDREDVKRVLIRLFDIARSHLDAGAPHPREEVAP